MKRLLIIPLILLVFGCEGVDNKQKQIESLQGQIDALERAVWNTDITTPTRRVDVDKLEKVQDMILDRIGYSVVKVPYESEHYVLVPSKSENYTVHGSTPTFQAPSKSEEEYKKECE